MEYRIACHPISNLMPILSTRILKTVLAICSLLIVVTYVSIDSHLQELSFIFSVLLGCTGWDGRASNSKIWCW